VTGLVQKQPSGGIKCHEVHDLGGSSELPERRQRDLTQAEDANRQRQHTGEQERQKPERQTPREADRHAQR